MSSAPESVAAPECRVLRVKYHSDSAINETVERSKTLKIIVCCAKIQQAIGRHEDLLTIVKIRKLKWYGHVSRSSGLVKAILQGTVKRGRRQSRQKKRWEDSIRHAGLAFAMSQRAVENREKWRKLVVKSSVVPQRPPWLRDR